MLFLCSCINVVDDIYGVFIYFFGVEFLSLIDYVVCCFYFVWDFVCDGVNFVFYFCFLWCVFEMIFDIVSCCSDICCEGGLML